MFVLKEGGESCDPHPPAPSPCDARKASLQGEGESKAESLSQHRNPVVVLLWTLLCGMLCRCSGVVPARSLTPMAAKQKQDNSTALCCCFALCRRGEVAATRRGEVCIVLDPPHSSPPRLCDSRERGPGGEGDTTTPVIFPRPMGFTDDVFECWPPVAAQKQGVWRIAPTLRSHISRRSYRSEKKRPKWSTYFLKERITRCRRTKPLSKSPSLYVAACFCSLSGP